MTLEGPRIASERLMISNLIMVKEILEKTGLSKQVRAEEVSVSQWFAIIKACQAAK